jgi:hypothetical protein
MPNKKEIILIGTAHPDIKYGSKIITLKNATFKKVKIFSQIEIKNKD